MPSVTSVSDNAPVSLNRPPRGFRLFSNGLHSEWVTPDGEICHARLCGWIEVTGVTRDAHGQEYGRVMEFITIDGARRRRVIPVRDIIGASRRVVGDLVDAGFDVELSGQSGLIQCLYYCAPRNASR